MNDKNEMPFRQNSLKLEQRASSRPSLLLVFFIVNCVSQHENVVERLFISIFCA